MNTEYFYDPDENLDPEEVEEDISERRDPQGGTSRLIVEDIWRADSDDDADFIDAERYLSSSGTSYLDFPAHAAAYNDDVERLLQLLDGLSTAQREQLDTQGNTVLHVAVLRRNISSVRALLESGFGVMVVNARKWLAIDIAISNNDRDMAKLLYLEMMMDMKRSFKDKKQDIMNTIHDMPDCKFKLQWELGSPVVGFLLRKFAPSDMYQVWKRGCAIRVDGALMGINEESAGLLPEWKRGHFSLLFDCSTERASVFLLDRQKQTYIDVQQEKKASKPDPDMEVDGLLREGAEKTKVRASEFRFKPAKGWLGGDVAEKVEGWRTRLYEATGKLMAVKTWLMVPEMSETATFEEYAQVSWPLDRVTELPIDPFSMGGKPGDEAMDQAMVKQEEDEAAAASTDKRKKGGRKKHAAKSARKLTARCWMAENFPISLQQLLPILDVVGYANKHVGKAAKFLKKYGDMALFPVKLQVPLLMTIYLMITFKDFHVLEADDVAMTDEAFFKVPAAFERRAMPDHLTGKRMGNGVSTPQRSSEGVKRTALTESSYDEMY